MTNVPFIPLLSKDSWDDSVWLPTSWCLKNTLMYPVYVTTSLGHEAWDAWWCHLCLDARRPKARTKANTFEVYTTIYIYRHWHILLYYWLHLITRSIYFFEKRAGNLKITPQCKRSSSQTASFGVYICFWGSRCSCFFFRDLIWPPVLWQALRMRRTILVILFLPFLFPLALRPVHPLDMEIAMVSWWHCLHRCWARRSIRLLAPLQYNPPQNALYSKSWLGEADFIIDV